jgi:predicted histone-like DNA-binding protein
MSIKFKALERAEPGVPGGGKKKWYAVSVFDRKANLSDLTVEIERISTVNRADVVAVLSALVQLIPKYLTNSFILYLGELGNFRSNIKSRGQQT